MKSIMKYRKNIYHVSNLAAIPMGILVLLSAALFAPPQSCTNISLARDGHVLFANNEDSHFRDLVIGFFPASSEGYGSVHLGFYRPDGSIEFGGAMNDQGLAWDVNSMPRAALTPHPERPFSHNEDNYLSFITKRAATVKQAIAIAKQFDFDDTMSLQFHIADASGDAVVISAGPDGELAFTRKGHGDDYLLLTNFNPANFMDKDVGWRYQTALTMLEEKNFSSGSISAYTGEILEAVHLNNLTSYTLYSNIFDLKNKEIHLFYMAQYNEVVVLNLAQELSKGKRVQDMQDFFSSETVSAGDAAYHSFETRFKTAKYAAIALGFSIFVGITKLTTHLLRKRQRGNESNRPNLGVVIKIL